MSLIKKQTLIPPCCAGTILDLDESTVRKGQGGTENLTQVRSGHGKRQRVHFILEEVLQLKSEWIEGAQKTRKITLRLVG